MTKRRAAKIGILLLFATAIGVLYFSPLRSYLTREHIRDSVGQLRDLWYGPLVLIGLYGVGCVFAIPASLFILAAGVIWGWKFGVLYAMCGGMLGAVASYYVGRFLGEGLLDRFGSMGRAVRRQVETAGFTSMLIVRLIPGPPFAVWNYAAGIAHMRQRDYFFGTLFGTFPAHLVFTYCADALFNGTMTQNEAVWRLLVVGLLLIAMVLIPRLIKRSLQKRARGLPTV
jgi:uncharacterized membrane protein YdjX (TVP38/TMEM64 family)